MSTSISLSGYTPRRAARRALTLIEIVMVISIGLGLVAGGLAFYRQASSTYQVSEYSQSIGQVSDEVRSQARTLMNFHNLSGATAAGANITAAVKSGSSLRASAFDDMLITGNKTDFKLTLQGLRSNVCNSLAATPFGGSLKYDAASSSCHTGTLVLTGTR